MTNKIMIILVFVVLLVAGTATAQVHIDGGPTDDRLGRSVAGTDNVDVVAAGEVSRVTDFLSWTSDSFNDSHSVDACWTGQRIIVGGEFKGFGTNQSHLYDYNGSSWDLVATFSGGKAVGIAYWSCDKVIITETGTEVGDIGESVIYSGPGWTEFDRMPGGDSATISGFGTYAASAYHGNEEVYTLRLDGVSTEKFVPCEVLGSQCGRALAFDTQSNRLGIGAPQGAGGQGICYFYDPNDSHTFVEAIDDRLIAPINETHGEFCESLAIRGQHVLVGAPQSDLDCPGGTPDCDAGRAYGYFNGVLVEHLSSPNPTTDGNYGQGVDFMQRVADGIPEYVVGEPGRNGGRGGVSLYFVNRSLFVDGFESGDFSAWSGIKP